MYCRYISYCQCVAQGACHGELYLANVLSAEDHPLSNSMGIFGVRIVVQYYCPSIYCIVYPVLLLLLRYSIMLVVLVIC